MFGKVLCAVSLLFILWAGISFVEINLQNKEENPNYSSINMFVVLKNMKEGR